MGIITAIAEINLLPSLSEWQQFALVSVVALIATVIGTYLTAPTEDKIITEFYNTTRPFGFWKPYKAKLPPEVRKAMEKEHRNDIIAVPFTLGWQVSIFLMPMQLMVGTYKEFFLTFSVFVCCITGMYFFWYRHLPPKVKVNKAAAVKAVGAEELA